MLRMRIVSIVVLCFIFQSHPLWATTKDEDARACDVLHDVALQRVAKKVITTRYPYVRAPNIGRTLKARRRPHQHTSLPDTQTSTSEGLFTALSGGRMMIVKQPVSRAPAVRQLLVFSKDKAGELRVNARVNTPTMSYIIAVKASGDRVVVVGRTSSSRHDVLVYDVRANKTPRQLARYTFTHNIDAIKVHRDHVYFTGMVDRLPLSSTLQALATSPDEALLKTLPPVVDATVAGRWPRLFNRRTHQERARAMGVLLKHYHAQVPRKVAPLVWPTFERIDMKGVATKSPLLGCQDLVVPTKQPATSLITLTSLSLQNPMTVQTVGVLSAFDRHPSRPLRTVWTGKSMYLAHAIDPIKHHLAPRRARAKEANATRVLKFTPVPKTGALLYRASRDLDGALWTSVAWAGQGEDVHMWLMHLGGKKPFRLVTLTENTARARLEVVHALTPLKPQTLVHSVHVSANALLLSHSLPRRLSVYDLKNPERPKKKSEIALAGQTNAWAALNDKHLVRRRRGGKKDVVEFWSLEKLAAPKMLKQFNVSPSTRWVATSSSPSGAQALSFVEARSKASHLKTVFWSPNNSNAIKEVTQPFSLPDCTRTRAICFKHMNWVAATVFSEQHFWTVAPGLVVLRDAALFGVKSAWKDEARSTTSD